MPIKLKLQSKIVLCFSLLTITIIAVFAVFFNGFIYRDIESGIADNLVQLNIKISEQIDSYITDVDQVAKNILVNQAITDALSDLPERRQPLTDYETMAYSRTLEENMSRIIALSSLPRPHAYIYSIDHQYSFAYDSLQSNFSDIHSQKPYSDLLLAKKMVLYPHNANSGAYSGINSFSIFRAIYDINSTLHGYIELQQNYAELDKICDTGDTGAVFILGPYQEIIYPAAAIDAKDLALLATFTEDGHLFRDQSGNLYSCVKSDYTGFTVILKHSAKDVFAPLYLIQNTTMLIIVVMALLSLLMIWFISKLLVQPIRALRDNILHISYDNMRLAPSGKDYIDEVALFNYTFQNMLDRLKESVERELTLNREEAKARFAALQAQISPHFIHNVLYVISISAQENRTNDAALMCKQLSNMLRYVVDSPFHTVSLEEEIQYTLNYLSLQKRHYEDFLTYEVEIDEAVKSVPLPRLVIQPFVENSLQHGFLQKAPPWHIRINALAENGTWQIQITDNGQGISAEIAHGLAKKLDGMEADIRNLKNQNDPGMSGIGIINTFLRLKLMYQGQLVFEIQNHCDGGVAVSIQGPLEAKLATPLG